MSQPVNVGIIGCGVIAGTHIESFEQIDGVSVKWACDLQLDRAQQRAQKYGIAHTTDDYHDLLADADVHLVSICTDHASHERIACDAFEAGKHVLCEKALTANAEQLDHLLDAHAQHEELVFSGIFQHRFDGMNRVTRRLITEGVLGTMLSASMRLRCYRPDSYYADDWHGTWEKEGGSVLINQAIHFLDAMVWIMGGAGNIAAHCTNRAHAKAIATEDTLTASVGFLSGALGTVEVTSASHLDWQHTLTFCGTEGEIVLRGGKHFTVSMKDEARQQEIEQMLSRANDPAGVEAGRAYYGTSHPAQIRDVVQAIREARAPFVTGEAASHTLRLVLGAYESHRTGRRIEVPAPMIGPMKAAAK